MKTLVKTWVFDLDNNHLKTLRLDRHLQLSWRLAFRYYLLALCVSGPGGMIREGGLRERVGYQLLIGVINSETLSEWKTAGLKMNELQEGVGLADATSACRKLNH